MHARIFRELEPALGQRQALCIVSVQQGISSCRCIPEDPQKRTDVLCPHSFLHDVHEHRRSRHVPPPPRVVHDQVAADERLQMDVSAGENDRHGPFRPEIDIGMLRLTIHQCAKGPIAHPRLDLGRGKVRVLPENVLYLRDPAVNRNKTAPLVYKGVHDRAPGKIEACNVLACFERFEGLFQVTPAALKINGNLADTLPVVEPWIMLPERCGNGIQPLFDRMTASLRYEVQSMRENESREVIPSPALDE